MPTSDDLVDLLAAIAEGDRRALGTLFDRTAPKLLAVAIRILADRAAAEDCVQDVYLRVWRNAGTYSPESGRAMTWLITIARNRAIDLVRARRVVDAAASVDGRDILADIPDPVGGGNSPEDARRLRLCLEALEPTQRRCFLEAYRDGYSREELAIRYDRPVSTIKTWLHRSAASLRDCLGER